MQSDRQLFFSVLRANQKQQGLASYLNSIAGQVIFKVYSDDELLTRTTTVLNGARNIGEVSVEQIEAMTLPALDEGMVREVRAKFETAQNAVHQYEETPVLTLAGQEVEVRNHRGTRPSVTLNVNWKSDLSTLPDEGIILPNGTRVTLRITAGYWDELGESGDIQALKHIIKDKFIGFALRQFQSQPESRSAIPIPDLVSNPEAELPPIIEYPVCRSPATGEWVKIYGTVKVSQPKRWERYLSSNRTGAGQLISSDWFISRQDAETARNAVESTLRNWRVKRKKNVGYQAEAESLAAQLLCLQEELRGTKLRVAEEIAEHLGEYAKLNYNRGSRVLSWNSQAELLTTRGDSAVANDADLLKLVIDKLTDELLSGSQDGLLQDQAIECIGVLEKRLATGSVTSPGGGPKVTVARDAVHAACNTDSAEEFDDEAKSDEDSAAQN